MKLDKSFWDNRYQNNTTGWDLGAVAPPISNYLDQLKDKEIKILVPGAGRAHEVIYAYHHGYEQVYICDISPTAIQQFKASYPTFPLSNIIEGDFFEIDNSFDLIIEQTFFCALNPEMRSMYVEKMHQLLKSNGKLVGLLFASKFERQGPPFGSVKTEYIDYFSDHFEIQTLEPCYNSIEPRMGNELFIIATRKN